MYHGETASEPDEAGKLFMALNIAQAEKDLRGAADVPLAAAGVDGRRSARSASAWAASSRCSPATHRAERRRRASTSTASIPNVKPDYAQADRRRCSGLFAEKDGFVTPAGRRDTEAAIKKAGKSVEIHIYPGVDHAFFNDENTAAYNKAAADDAWRRTLGHFRQHLK